MKLYKKGILIIIITGIIITLNRLTSFLALRKYQVDLYSLPIDNNLKSIIIVVFELGLGFAIGYALTFRKFSRGIILYAILIISTLLFNYYLTKDNLFEIDGKSKFCIAECNGELEFVDCNFNLHPFCGTKVDKNPSPEQIVMIHEKLKGAKEINLHPEYFLGDYIATDLENNSVFYFRLEEIINNKEGVFEVTKDRKKYFKAKCNLTQDIYIPEIGFVFPIQKGDQYSFKSNESRWDIVKI